MGRGSAGLGQYHENHVKSISPEPRHNFSLCEWDVGRETKDAPTGDFVFLFLRPQVPLPEQRPERCPLSRAAATTES